MNENTEKRGGFRINAKRPSKNWKPLNLKIDADLSDYLDSLCVIKGDKTKIIETLLRELKTKNESSL